MNISTADGHCIVGLLSKSNNLAKSSEIVVLCHGITSEKNEGGLYSEFAQLLSDHSVDSYRFDFRGHGDSSIPTQDISIAGEILDLFTVLTTFNKEYEKVSVVAASFGASILLLLFENYLPNKLHKVAFLNPVTNYESTFTSTKLPWASSFFPQNDFVGAVNKSPINIGDKHFTLGGIMVADLYYYKPYLMTWPKNIPLKIYHGRSDTVVACSDSENFIKTQDNKKINLLIYNKCGHGLEEKKEEVFDNLIGFLINDE